MKQRIFTFTGPDGKMLVGRFVVKPEKRTKDVWILPLEMQIGTHLPPLKKGEVTF